MSISETDLNQLAHQVQKHVPFTPYPYRELAQGLNLSETQVLDQLIQWSDEGKLREICAVLEGASLGYDSALVASRVPQDRIEDVAKILNQHPTITHNYQRNHDFNLWFTLAVPPEMSLETTLEILAEQTGVDAYYPMPRTHTFKIGVSFDIKGKHNHTQRKTLVKLDAFEPDERQKRMLRALQFDLPYVSRPYREVAQKFQIEEEELIAFGQTHQNHLIRRYGGTFRHRKLGVQGNGMIVWQVAEDKLEDMGMRIAAFPPVSHCYAREPIPGFEYNLYSMVHGPDQEHCRKIADEIADKVDNLPYVILFSSHEYKKERLRYFLPELDQWWAKNKALAKAKAVMS